MENINDIVIENKCTSLANIIFDEFDKMGITPTNSEWKMMQTLSQAIEIWYNFKEKENNDRIQTWLIENFAPGIEEWLIKDYEPSKMKFTYWMLKEFPKTFHKFLNQEEEIQDIENENIEEAEYEEI